MPDAISRAGLGFTAAVIAVLTFHQAMWWVLHLAGLMPPPYPVSPTQPFGAPLIVSLCFWGGLYGLAFGLAMPGLRGPLWLWGLAFGLLATAVGLFVVGPIKGWAVNLSGASLLRPVLINGFWGIGLGLIAPALMRAGRRRVVV